MKNYLKKYGLRVLGILLPVVVITIVVSGLLSGQAGIVGNTVGAIRTPVQGAASAMSQWLSACYGRMFEYDKVVAENEHLKAQLAEAEERARELEEEGKENVRLREVLDLKQKRTDFVLESAKIVSWNASNFSSSFTISKGRDHGIEVDDCVITEYSALVGTVMEVGDNWAVVRAVIDVDMNIGALVGEGGNAAMIVGDFYQMQKGYTKLTHLTAGTQLVSGDLILTSGKGGKFPQGLTIGKIVSVETEVAGQTQYGVVKPAYDADKTAQVFIVKEFEVIE